MIVRLNGREGRHPTSVSPARQHLGFPGAGPLCRDKDGRSAARGAGLGGDGGGGGGRDLEAVGAACPSSVLTVRSGTEGRPGSDFKMTRDKQPANDGWGRRQGFAWPTSQASWVHGWGEKHNSEERYSATCWK